MKTCTKCKIEKPPTEFNRQLVGTKDGLTYKCKTCAVIATKLWAENNREYVRESNRKRYAANPEPKKASSRKYRMANLEKAKATNKAWRIKNNDAVRARFLRIYYNLSVEQYEEMYKSQNGCCKICNEQNLNGKRLFVDHDHASGNPRGLLCDRCNRGLGYFRDNSGFLESAITYLNQYQSKEKL